MAKVIQATWDDLARIAHGTRDRLLVCTPYYSAHGLARMSKALPSGVGLTFMSRISPSEWAIGVSSPDALAQELGALQEQGHSVQLIVHQRLHAKAYLADGSAGLVGSANLSSAGFDKNFELMLDLNENEARAATEVIDNEARQDGRSLTLDSLGEWVSRHAQKIAEQTNPDPDLQGLADVQRELDRLLGYGQGHAEATSIADIDHFVAWLKNNPSLSGASVLHDRYENVGRQNLTGHFRQSYYAVCRFLGERDRHVGSLAAELDLLDADDLYQPNQAVLDDWIRHLDAHATTRAALYDYAILRGILPPSLGGTRIGGGGGSSTLKRMLPLVARFLNKGSR